MKPSQSKMRPLASDPSARKQAKAATIARKQARARKRGQL